MSAGHLVHARVVSVCGGSTTDLKEFLLVTMVLLSPPEMFGV